MERAPEVIVVGGGVMGLSTAYHLARGGHQVLLLEARGIGHSEGSSHGPSRIIRFTYQSEDYIELARAAFALWETLGDEAGVHLPLTCGGLDFGPPASANVPPAAAGAGLSPPEQAVASRSGRAAAPASVMRYLSATTACSLPPSSRRCGPCELPSMDSQKT